MIGYSFFSPQNSNVVLTLRISYFFSKPLLGSVILLLIYLVRVRTSMEINDAINHTEACNTENSVLQSETPYSFENTVQKQSLRYSYRLFS